MPSRRATGFSLSVVPFADECGSLLGGQVARAVGAQQNVAAPARQLERQSVPALPAAVARRERFPAQLPAVAVRAMKHTLSIEVPESGNVRDVVHDTGRQEQATAGERATVGSEHVESASVHSRGTDDFDHLVPDVLEARQFLASQPPELQRRRAFARDETVQHLREAVPPAVLVEHAAPCGTRAPAPARRSDRQVRRRR